MNIINTFVAKFKHNKMKKLILAFVSVVALASCNKEANLENRLEGKWKIDSETITGSTTVTIDYPEGSGMNDTSYVSSTNNENVTTVTTGDIDFISDNKLVKNVITTTTFNYPDGEVDVDVDEEEHVAEYYVSDKDEITLIEDGDYTVFNVTTNKRDAQVWEYDLNDIETETDYYTEVTTTYKYSMKYSISLSLIK